MQAALEAGQLNRVSEMLGISPSSIAESVGGRNLGVSKAGDEPLDTSGNSENKKTSGNNKDGYDWDDFYDWFNEDSV